MRSLSKFALIALSGLAIQGHAQRPSIIPLTINEKGFQPSSIDVKPGTDVTLRVLRTTDATCAKQLQVPDKKVKVDVPLNKPVDVKIGKLDKGEIRFGCGMDMMLSGMIIAN